MKQAFARILATSAFSLVFAAAGHAHHAWIEQDAQGAVLYFGEFGANLREASPGLLDKFVKPVARRVGAQGAHMIEVTRSGGGFALSASAAPGESLLAEETAYPLSERREGDKSVRSLYAPAARLVTTLERHEPLLPLDLVPTGARDALGAQFQVFFRGQPLAKAKVAVVTASGWSREAYTDAQGRITVPLPWRGTYVLEVAHRDATPGRRADGAGYDRAAYVTSLTFMQADGLPALPPPAPAAPNLAQ